MNVHYRKEKTRATSRGWLTLWRKRKPTAFTNVATTFELGLEDTDRMVGVDTVMGLTLLGADIVMGLTLLGADTVMGLTLLGADTVMGLTLLGADTVMGLTLSWG